MSGTRRASSSYTNPSSTLDSIRDFGVPGWGASRCGASSTGGSLCILLFVCFFTLAGTVSAQSVTPNQVGGGSLLARAGGGYTPLPLLGMEIDVDIEGILVRSELSQVFHNPSPQCVEAIYVFPLPERAAVDDLELQIGDRRIVGEIHERREAQRIYADAKRAGRKASLLEQERPNLFTVSVANINPGETVQVHLRYLEEVRLEGNEFSFVFPMTFTPRYLPQRQLSSRERSEDVADPASHDPDAERTNGSDDIAARSPQHTTRAQTVSSREGFFERFYDPADAERILPPFRSASDWDAPRARVSVRMRPGWPTRDVRSISHDISVAEENPGEWTVTLEDGSVRADRDFHLRWSPIQTDVPQAAFLTETRDDGDYGLLMLLPPQEGAISASDLPTETLFVLDVSGSMDGPSIVQARRALQAALDRMAPADRFNILAFNQSTQLFQTDFQPAGTAERAAARRWVGKLKADGGTEILGALRRGLGLWNENEPESIHRRIVFITDGAVGNELDVLSEVRKKLGELRIHTLGIGHAPNRYLMNKLAEYGRGHCEYLSTDPDLEARMDEFLARIERPAVTSLTLAWNGVDPTDLSPEILPDLYSGQPLYLSARLSRTDSSARLPPSVTVAGRIGSQSFTQSVLATPASDPRSGIGTRWARARVGRWMDAAILGTDRTEIRENVIALGREFHLVTKYTSLVAVEQMPTAETALLTERVPNALPHGSQLGGTLPQGGTDRPQRMLLAALLALFGLGIWASTNAIMDGRWGNHRG